MGQDHYATLGLPRTASPTQVTLAFFERVREQDHDSDTRELYKAYEVLSNLDRRRAYDAELAAAPQDAAPVQPPPVQPGPAPSRRSAPPSRRSAPMPRTSARRGAGLQRPRGWTWLPLSLLVAYGVAFLVAGALATRGSVQPPAAIVPYAIVSLGSWALLAWLGVRQIVRRRWRKRFLVGLPLLVLLLGLPGVSPAMGGGIPLIAGLFLYFWTVAQWRSQQCS